MDQEGAIALLEGHAQARQAELSELLKKYDVVSVNNDNESGAYIILTERKMGEYRTVATDNVGFAEMSYSDPSPYTSWTRREHVPELVDRRGMRMFYDMTRNDGAVRGALRIIKTPIQGADWYVEPWSDSTIDKNIAKFIEKNLFEDLDCIWEHFVEDCLRSLDYGFFSFEKVFAFDGSKLKLEKLTPLHPLDVQGWQYDGKNRLIGLRLEPLNGLDYTQPIDIPINKILHVTFEKEGGDLRGTSILRTAFKHWYYKDTLYKIDAIQKERHAVGVPVIKLPMGFTPTDKTTAEELGRNLRTNERGYITCPENWDIYFAKLEGQPVDIIPSIEHHDKKIYETILAAFMGESQISKESMDTFYKSTRYVAKSIAAVINREVIKPLVDLNFLRKGGYPKLKARRMGEWEDLRTMTFALRNMVGAEIITPDEPLEKWARQQMDLPDFDEKTARGKYVEREEAKKEAELAQKQQIQQPQTGNLTNPSQNVNPPKVGGPRQTNLPRVAPPSGNTGADRSGGK